MSHRPSSILVIRHGAFGDFVQSFAPFEAVRAHAPQARITLLTTQPFVSFAAQSPWFDTVLADPRPDWRDPVGLWRLRRILRGADLVVDLQTSRRTQTYFRLAGRPVWSGHVPGSALPHDNPRRDDMHTRARQADQLRRAGITPVERADISWLQGLSGMPQDRPYALLVPGAAPHRPAKRWPVARFAALATAFEAAGIRPVIAGAAHETPLADAIRAVCPSALDMTGRTDLVGLARLAAGAVFAVGNDTGPMHLAAEMGTRSVVLFSGDSNPALTAPVGRMAGQVSILRSDDLARIPAERVAALLL